MCGCTERCSHADTRTMFSLLSALRGHGSNTRTVRPVRLVGRGNKRLAEFATATLNKGIDVHEAVKLPLGEGAWTSRGAVHHH